MAAGLLATAAPDDPIVEPHVHLFSADLQKFPKHKNGPALKPAPLEDYVPWAKRHDIRYAVHVSAEPYQDDTRYLEYTLRNAPKGFLKGIVLLDTIRPETPARFRKLSVAYPNQLLGLRIHCVRNPGERPTTGGAIRNRDLFDANARKVWETIGDMHLWVQAHIMPWFARDIAKLATEYENAHVIVDHFGHAGVNGKESYGYKEASEFSQITDLAKVPSIILKVSGLQYSSREPFPHRDLGSLARQAYDAFGPDRLVWGSLGTTDESFNTAQKLWEEHFSFVSASDARKIRFENARRLFRFGA